MPPKQSGPPAKQTSEEAAKKRILDPITDRPSDKVTTSTAVKRGQTEPVENITNVKVAEKPKPSATTNNAITSTAEETGKTAAKAKDSVATKADVGKNAAAPAVAKPVTDEKKAAAPLPETQSQVIKRPRSL